MKLYRKVVYSRLCVFACEKRVVVIVVVVVVATVSVGQRTAAVRVTMCTAGLLNPIVDNSSSRADRVGAGAEKVDDVAQSAPGEAVHAVVLVFHHLRVFTVIKQTW